MKRTITGLFLLAASLSWAQFQPPGGTLTLPQTSTDVATPANPASGKTSWYTKGGTFCALSPLGVETCTGMSSGGANITQGTFASLPATCTTNDVYIQTDGPYTLRCSATNTWSAFLQEWGLVTVPPSVGWTSDNISTGSFDSTNGSRYAAALPANSDAHGLRVQFATAPSTPYAVTAGIRHNSTGMPPGTAPNAIAGWGIGFGDGTGKYVFFNYFLNAAIGSNVFTESATSSTGSFSNLTTFSTTGVYQALDLINSPLSWVCIADDGTTNLTFYWSLDRHHWKLFDTQGRTAFMSSGPTRIAWGADTFGSVVDLTLVDWTINTSAATCK